MPCRNVLPKPRQKPHPPMWMACTNRDTIKVAARNGLGALAFSFVDPDEAKSWVDIYYDIIRSEECVPLGHTRQRQHRAGHRLLAARGPQRGDPPRARKASSSSATRSMRSSPTIRCPGRTDRVAGVPGAPLARQRRPEDRRRRRAGRRRTRAASARPTTRRATCARCATSASTRSSSSSRPAATGTTTSARRSSCSPPR